MSDTANTFRINSDEQLKGLITELGLSCTPSFLREVYKCLSAEKIDAELDVLKFFDAIYRSAISIPKNIYFSEPLTEDKEIIRTFCDVSNKARYLCRNNTSTFSLNDILSISSEYLSAVGAYDPKNVKSGSDADNLSIRGENGEKLVSLSLGNVTDLPYGYC